MTTAAWGSSIAGWWVAGTFCKCSCTSTDCEVELGCQRRSVLLRIYSTSGGFVFRAGFVLLVFLRVVSRSCPRHFVLLLLRVVSSFAVLHRFYDGGARFLARSSVGKLVGVCGLSWRPPVNPRYSRGCRISISCFMLGGCRLLGSGCRGVLLGARVFCGHLGARC